MTSPRTAPLAGSRRTTFAAPLLLTSNEAWAAPAAAMAATSRSAVRWLRPWCAGCRRRTRRTLQQVVGIDVDLEPAVRPLGQYGGDEAAQPAARGVPQEELEAPLVAQPFERR